MHQKTLLDLARKHGTPLFVVDHAELRRNYTLFRRHFPRVQVYYAVKVNADPAIVQTFCASPEGQSLLRAGRTPSADQVRVWIESARSVDLKAAA